MRATCKFPSVRMTSVPGGDKRQKFKEAGLRLMLVNINRFRFHPPLFSILGRQKRDVKMSPAKTGKTNSDNDISGNARLDGVARLFTSLTKSLLRLDDA